MDTLRIVREREGKPRLPKGLKVLRFDAAMDLAPEGIKSFTLVKDANDRLVDVRDVKIKGYLSTFQNVTASDRDGDYVMPGAFNETIPTFMRNPVLLVNHNNDVESLAGNFTVVKEDEKGLYVEAVLTNSPHPRMVDVRFKVAEGFLRTMSMGGLFYYTEGGRGIFKVALWEGSLTPIPANPDALFSTRSLNESEIKRVTIELDSAAAVRQTKGSNAQG